MEANPPPFKVRIPTPLMFAFIVIRYELKTYLGFSFKGYGEILLRHINSNPYVEHMESSASQSILRIHKQSLFWSIFMGY